MKKIVTIGGGTGSFSVLRGLKQYPYEITAVATMFDSGGSSGVLRDEHGVLPPGDVRRCLVALSEGWREETMRQLFNYRFENGNSLKGHSFGNILLTALSDILGNEAAAIEQAGMLLNIRGKVLPVSLEKAHLCAELEDGSVIEGETNIDIREHPQEKKIKRAFLKPNAQAYDDVLSAIEDADGIVFGPGDLYTSLIPNLLVDGVVDAIKNSKAKKVYVLNLFTKPGETDGYTASMFAQAVLDHADIGGFDTLVYNNGSLPEKIIEQYKTKGQLPVDVDETFFKYGKKSKGADLFSGENVLRHDPRKLAEVIADILR